MANRWQRHGIAAVAAGMALALAACDAGKGGGDVGADAVDSGVDLLDPGPCGCTDLPGDDVPPADTSPDPASVDAPPPTDSSIPDALPPDVPPPTDLGPADLGVLDVPPEDPGLPPATLGKVSPAALKAELEAKDFLLINVHVPYDGQIPGTDKHITYLDIDAIAAYMGADLGVKTVVYCLSNYMSLIAGDALVARGYRNVRYLDGGMGAWKSAGYPFEN